MVESGLGGQLWFSAKDALNVTCKERFKTTLYMQLYGKKKVVAKFRAIGCCANVYLNKEWRGKGKHIPLTIEAISVCFATDYSVSGY